MSVETGTPSDLLEAHPETAYFWGRVVGDGDLSESSVTVRASDENAARRLAAIAGAERVDHRILEREYAHDTAITRTEDEYTVQVFGDLAETSSGGYWFGVDDDAVPTVGPWLYDGSRESGLFAPSRRRKLLKSLEQAGVR